MKTFREYTGNVEGVPSCSYASTSVASKMTHANPIQTGKPFAWASGQALTNGPIGLFDTQTEILDTSIQHKESKTFLTKATVCRTSCRICPSLLDTC